MPLSSSLSWEKTPAKKPEYSDIYRMFVAVQGDGDNTYSAENTGWAEEMSCDNISACRHVWCFVDKAIMQRCALDIKIVFSISVIFFVAYSFPPALGLHMSFNY